MASSADARFIPHARIQNVRLSLASDADVRANAVVEIHSHDLFQNGLPVPGGAYDAATGSTDYSYRCSTCDHDKNRCLGHPGVLELPVPVATPLGINEQRRWLRIICTAGIVTPADADAAGAAVDALGVPTGLCGALLIDPAAYARFPASTRLEDAAKNSRKGTACPACGRTQPEIRKTEDDHMTFSAVGPDGHGRKLLPTILEVLFARVPDSAVVALGRPLASAPRNLLIRAFPVAPTSIRPSVRRAGGGPSSYQDITTLLQRIVRTANIFSAAIAGGEALEEANMLNLGQFVYEEMRGSSGTSGRRALKIGSRPFTGIAMRWAKKSGRLRQTLCAKRAGHSCRSTIAGNSQLGVDQIGVPLFFAQALSVTETVQEFNLERLTRIFLNGKRRYPGCTQILKKRTGRLHNVEKLQDDYGLEIGDVVLRNLVSGDHILFNRQPTLLPPAIGTHEVVVIQDPRVLTLLMNVTTTPYYNADFDGDQMNAPVPRSVAARAESSVVSRVAANFVSAQNGSPITGQVQDGCIGSFELTRDGVAVARAQAMALFAGVPGRPPVFPPEKAAWTGREIASLVLAASPITYKRAPAWFDEGLAPYVQYRPGEIFTEIVDGVVRRGVLDARAIGDKAGGVFHRIAGKYGPDRALQAIFAYQQVVLGFLGFRGFSVGVADFMVPEGALAELRAIIGRTLTEAAQRREEFDRGDAIPPIGQTHQQFYEDSMMAILHQSDDLTKTLLSAIDANRNRLFRLAKSGSKGKVNNHVHISAGIGLIRINGKRVPEEFAYHRTSPYAPRYPSRPQDQGFVESRYLEGLTANEFVYAAMNGRFDLINKALSTSLTGDLNRRNVKALEAIVTDNLGGSLEFDTRLVQQLFGDDGLNPARLVRTKFPKPADGSDDADDAGTSVSLTGADGAAVAALLARQRADYAFFVAAGRRLEGLSRSRPFNGLVQVPAGAEIALDDVLSKLDDPSDSPKAAKTAKATKTAKASKAAKTAKTAKNGELAAKIATLEVWLARLPFAFLNSARADAYIAVLRASNWDPALDGAPSSGVEEQPSAASSKPGATGSKPGARRLHPWPVYAAAASATARYMRAMLTPARLAAIPPPQLDELLLRALRGFQDAIMPAGSCVGLQSAQYYSERQTQYMLDSHKRTDGTSKAGVSRVKEVLTARPAAKERDPRMLLRLAPAIEGSAARAREVANSLEVLTLRTFAVAWQVFYERFGEPAHPAYAHEAALIAAFGEYRPAVRPPADLSWFCVRFELDRTALVFKSMPLETVVRALAIAHPDVYFVHSSENASKGGPIVLRAYLSARAFRKERPTLARALEMKDALLGRVLRGVSGIASAEVVALPRAGDTVHAVETRGTNLADVLVHGGVDPLRSISYSVQDTFLQFGVAAARRRIVEELAAALQDQAPDPRWISVYADRITFGGELVSLDYAAGKKRTPEHLYLRMVSSTPLKNLEDAVLRGAHIPVHGARIPGGGSMSESLMVGSVPRVGTAYNDVAVDPVLAREFQSVDSLLDDL